MMNSYRRYTKRWVHQEQEHLSFVDFQNYNGRLFHQLFFFVVSCLTEINEPSVVLQRKTAEESRKKRTANELTVV